MVTPPPRTHWQRTQRLTAGLLMVWLCVTFVSGFFASDLTWVLFGWPFSFWLAAQGALVVYVLIVCGYAWAMNRLDREHGIDPDA
ncbi:MAG: DUF4212 domain-containing protein [Burkholderiales bacterium]|nr:DUF4212 domain-containing protein [Burkholderiales bacterium]